MPNWTQQQKNAIDVRNCNVIVSAAAGSGKTAVLVERVIKMITDTKENINIDQLLIVTFTNAAAAEMKNRISLSLRKILEENPNDSNALLQLSLLPNAKICTIDSFCINLVRENFFELSISQDFTIMDTSQEKIVEQEALEEIISEYYDKSDENFEKLINLLSNTKNDKKMLETVTQVNDFIKAQPFPYKWLEKICEMYNPDNDLDNSSIKNQIYDEVRYYLSESKNLLRCEFESLDPNDEIYDILFDILSDDKDNIDKLECALNEDWDKLYNVLKHFKFTPMTRKRKSISKKDIQSYRKPMIDIVDKEIIPLVTMSKTDYEKNCIKVYPLLKLITEIVKKFNDSVLERKHEMNSFSFSDIEHFAIDLLFYVDDSENIIQTPLAKELENNFKEILVDEYQDTNKAQDTLFEKLSNGKNRFMVGDVKQSIYKFRLAMPEIFNNKKDEFSLYDANSDTINQKIILDKNFRSRLGICEFTNFIFTNLMSKRIGELDYNDEEKLNANNDYIDTDIASAGIRLIEYDKDQDVNKYENEALQIAEFIKSKIDAKEQIKDNSIKGEHPYRNINYGDFAILFRSPKNKMPIYAKALTEKGIPVSSNNRQNLFENNEVNILLSLIRVVDNPIQDIPLMATLMSVFYGYTADDIATAKLKYKSQNLYTAIINCPDIFDKFIKDLDKYRKYAASMSVEDFIRLIIKETSYTSIITAMGNPEQRKANISKLVELAKKFDSGTRVGLTAFVRYVDMIIDSKLEIESGTVNNSANDAVKLMSIHQSKGLEFPVVILAGASSKYNNQDLNDIVLLNSEYGIGIKVYDEDYLCRYNSLQYSYIKDKNLCASISENLRVLYVALTRAKEQFYVFCTFENIATHLAGLSKKIINGKIYPSVVKHINNDADAILLCALMHKDCSELREIAEYYSLPQFDYDFKLDCKILNQIDIENDFEIDKVKADNEIIKSICEKLDYKYPYSELATMASKRTASSLDQADMQFTFTASSKPAFLNDGSMTPAEKGTAMHCFMQFCDYKNAKTDLQSEIKRLTDGCYISKLQADNLNTQKLEKLFNSNFAERLFSSDKIYREIKVSCFVPASEIENTNLNDKILIQGIADCVFEENGELVIVDYKTDRVSNEEELLTKYKKQIDFYKKSIEKIMEKPVKEALLYSFHLDKPCVYK